MIEIIINEYSIGAKISISRTELISCGSHEDLENLIKTFFSHAEKTVIAESVNAYPKLSKEN